MRTRRIITTLLALALLATAAPASGATGATSAPAATSAKKVRSVGLATWFGPGFFGNRTACGQVLVPGLVGVAHRTLPCGTLVRVSYHGRALVLPVVDRGPYTTGVDWDLTEGAALALGVDGTARIHTRVVGRTAVTSTLGLPPAALTASHGAGSLAGGTVAG